MKNLLITAAILVFSFSSCISPAPITTPGAPPANADGSRNFVLIMHGETCDEENMANNMYCENSHETATIVVTVDITWKENGQPRHENKTVSVPPNGKTLLGCEWRNGTALQFEIMTSKYQ